MSLTQQDIEAIRNITATHQEAHRARDWDRWMSTCADDAVFLQPGGPKMEGRSAVRAWMDEFPITKEVTWTVEAVDGDGDFGFSRGHGPMVLEIEGKVVPFTLKWLSVFRKQSDGSWKLKNLCWNFDEPVSV